MLRQVFFKVAGDAVCDAARQLFLVVGRGEFARFIGVGDEGGFNQHGGYGERAQHDEVGAVDALAVDVAQAGKFVQGAAGKRMTGFDGCFLLDAE